MDSGQDKPRQVRTFCNRAIASAAGKKGGQGAAPAKRSFSRNRELARTAGRKGGLAKPKAKSSVPAE